MDVGQDLQVDPEPLYSGGGASKGIYQATTASGMPLLFKQYNEATLRDLNAVNLHQLWNWRTQLSPSDRLRLDGIGAFPLSSGWVNGRLCGVLMAPAPDTYMHTDLRKKVIVPTPADLMAKTKAQAQRIGVPYFPPPQKLAIIGHLIENLDFLHRLGIVVGDLQPQNLLIGSQPAAVGNFLIDCDSVWLNGQYATPPRDPEHWRVRGVRAFTPESDLHKALLLAARVIWEDIAWFDPEEPEFTDQDARHLGKFMLSSNVRIFERVLGHGESANVTAIKSAARSWRRLGPAYLSNDKHVRMQWIDLEPKTTTSSNPSSGAADPPANQPGGASTPNQADPQPVIVIPPDKDPGTDLSKGTQSSRSLVIALILFLVLAGLLIVASVLGWLPGTG
jgi:hypothetical protein